MANTYSQIHIHVLFAVRNRSASIQENWKELYKYITGIIQGRNRKMIAINGMPDHVHVLFGLRPDESLSELIRHAKGDSSKWINANKLTPTRFEWQQGFAAFSYSKSLVSNVISYIENQELHHSKKTFIEEYKEMLDKFSVNYNESYIFKPME